tara:strand:- start:2169 stop:3452 length:1284 start_codon:yes stop_codon:yes gene_type:complete
MANEALIQGAKYAYGAGTSAGAAMRQANIQRTQQRSQAKQLAMMQKKAKRKAQEAEMESTISGYIDSLPPDFDVSQIPSKYRGAISEKLLALKNEAAQAAQDIVQYSPGEVGYQMNVDIINKAKNAMNNMKTQFDQLGKDKQEFLEDHQTKNFSAANDPGGKMFGLSQLYTDNLDIRIGDDGNLFFSGEGVEEFNLNTANQNAPFTKANSQAKEFLELNKSIYNSGKDISDAERQMHQNQISNMLDEGGWNVTQSFLADDLFGTPLDQQISTVNINGQSYSLDEAMDMANSNDTNVSIDAKEAINDAVKDQLMTHLNNSATKGKEAKGGDDATSEFTFNDDGSLSDDFFVETMTVPAVKDGDTELQAAYDYEVYPTVEHRTSTNKELRIMDGRYVVYDTSTDRKGSSISLSASQEQLNKFLKRHFKV